MTTKKVGPLDLLFNTISQSQPEMLRKGLMSLLELFMDHEVREICGAEMGERTQGRMNQRNGYRERDFETRMGTVSLAIPKLRQGSYFPSFLEPRKRWEKAFVSVVCEAYIHGVSTRKVEDLVEAMGAKGMSRTTVSRMVAELEEVVQEFRNRRIDIECPYLWLDATYIKVRQGGCIVNKATLLAYGVNAEGEREVLGVEVADGEMEDAWRSFLASLVQRGLRGVKLVISDAHAGLKASLGVLNGAGWQRCRVHFMRNILTRVPKPAQGFVGAAVRQIFDVRNSTDLDYYGQACARLDETIKLLRPKYPAAAKVLEDGGLDALNYLNFPKAHHRQLHSTNLLERLNREIKRRVDVVGIFPNESSALRLVTMLIIEQNDEWQVGRRYFSLESMAEIGVMKNEGLQVA
jgi:transposase-like protein